MPLGSTHVMIGCKRHVMFVSPWGPWWMFSIATGYPRNAAPTRWHVGDHYPSYGVRDDAQGHSTMSGFWSMFIH